MYCTSPSTSALAYELKSIKTARMLMKYIDFFNINPPRVPATIPLPIWINVQGPWPPNMKKFERYQLDAPTKAPFLIPNSEPAISAMNVIGSTLGRGCSNILPRTAVVIKVNIMSASSNFRIERCF